MSRHSSPTKTPPEKGHPSGRVCRRQKGPDLILPDDGSSPWVLDRDLPRPAHGAGVQVTRLEDGKVLGYVLIEAAKAATIVGRVDKRQAQTFMQVESAIREARYPLSGAEALSHGQYISAALEHEQATVLEVLGEQPSAGLRIASVIDEFQLPGEFPQAVEQAAQAITAPNDVLPREDLRGQAFVTIDGEDAKDFDDAVLVKRRGLAFTLFVAIADVSAHVGVGDVIDREARSRGTSVYFPGRVLPMLPHRLSDDLCSLRPQVDRAVLVCELKVSRRGRLTGYRFFPATIHSHARLTYNQVAQALEDQHPKEWSAGVSRNVNNLAKLHSALQEQREIRGALDFASRELTVELDDDGQVAALARPQRNVAHRIIEECMILANVAAAQALRRAKQPFLARIHEPPPAEKLAALREFLAMQGMQLGGGVSPSPKDYAQVLAQAGDSPQAATIQMAVLQSLQQAVYAPSDAGHFGLALDDYAHFTSPIRRYPDLIVHRALYAMLGGPSMPQEQWEQLGQQLSALERRADKASWAVLEALKFDLLEHRLGETLPGVVGGVTDFGLFVELPEYAVSGLVHISELGSDYFVYDPEARLLRGRRSGQTFRLGQTLDVRIAAVNPAARKLDLVPANARSKTRQSSKRRRR